jgi:Pyruvate/2-oxoacid:ferredoxin oxidoreductase gamma subunit
VIAARADHWVVLDPSVIAAHLPRDEIKPGAIVILNTSDHNDFGINARVGVVDAIKIEEETGLIKSGTLLVSSTMLGAWAKATGIIRLKSIL